MDIFGIILGVLIVANLFFSIEAQNVLGIGGWWLGWNGYAG